MTSTSAPPPRRSSDLQPEREFNVRLSRAGYSDMVFKVRLGPGERKSLAKALRFREPVEEEPLPVQEKKAQEVQSRVLVADHTAKGGKGFLSAESSPSAYLYIDGVFTGRSTPIIGHPLADGGHTVVLRTPDGRTQAWQVRIKAGETIRLNKDF